MSRLERHQKNQLTAKIVVFSVILLIVVYFVLTIGFKLLFSMSLFIAGMTNKTGSVPLTKTSDIVGSVDVNSIPVATNSATITVGGSVMNLNKIEFYINDVKVKSVTLDASDSFNEDIGNLQKGDNSVYVKAFSSDGQLQKHSKTFDVFYKPDKPKLDISQPADKTKTDNPDIVVHGTTDKETFVKINDSPAVVDANGTFDMDIQLKEGDNPITVTATDDAGNTETKTLTVTYQKD